MAIGTRPEDTTLVSFYVELEPSLSGNNNRVYGVKAVRLTQSTKPLIRKPHNKVVRLTLTVPNSAFLADVPTVAIDIANKDLTGFEGEPAPVAA